MLAIRLHHASLFVLAVAAAAAPWAEAQDTTQGNSRNTSQNGGQNHANGVKAVAAVDYRSMRWLRKRDVFDDNGNKLAAVADFVLDRSTGVIDFAVLRAGVDGVGVRLAGRHVSVPYASLRWDGKNDRFLLATTPERLGQMPIFDEKDWEDGVPISETAPPAPEAGPPEQAEPDDPYFTGLGGAKPIVIEGTVTKVERVRLRQVSDRIVATLETDDGVVRHVTLGPTWFVNASPASPLRGDRVKIEALELPRDPGHLSVGTRIVKGSGELRLRDAEGRPAWALRRHRIGTPEQRITPAWHVLASSLINRPLACRGKDCGELDDLVVERVSGTVAFVSVDPNENFFGIADVKRLMPWSVAVVRPKGEIGLDASREMVLGSPRTPGETVNLNTGPTVERVWNLYEVSRPEYRVRPTGPVVAVGSIDSWSAGGNILGAMDAKSEQTVSGTVVKFVDVTFANGTAKARAVVVRRGDGEETVLLGPITYVEHQKLPFEVGDAVSVRACKTTIDGKPHWLARQVDAKDNRITLIDDARVPSWDPR
jgi:sporulation protein YlmC with PRC-barrel domain